MSTDLQRFFGGDILPQNQLRRKITANDVPQDDHGLLQLAEEGAWAATAQLAERLENQQIDPKTMAKKPGAALRYVLVRVTAFIKMDDHDKALQIIERLGNLHGSHYQHPDTKKTVAPFSLLFLYAVLPNYTASNRNPQLALLRLTDLLKLCKEEEAENATGPALITWRAREKRVLRGLVGVYFDLGMYAEAVEQQQALCDAETDDVKELRFLQQLGCMCLRCGNPVAATGAFAMVKNFAFDPDDENSVVHKSTLEMHKMMVIMNDAFISAFYGKFKEASEKLSVAIGVAGRRRNPIETRDDALREVDASKTRLSASAELSYLMLNPYTTNPAEDTTGQLGVQALVKKLEQMIRNEPKLMLSMDATVYNITLMYRLEGCADPDKRRMLQSVVECFRCDEAAFPRMPKR